MASEIFYKSMKIRCTDDSVTRAVNVKCYRYDGSFAADTFFSVPAHTRVKGKYVHGYVGTEDGKLFFSAHTVCKGAFASTDI